MYTLLVLKGGHYNDLSRTHHAGSMEGMQDFYLAKNERLEIIQYASPVQT